MSTDSLTPIALTDDQLDHVLRCAEPLPRADRGRYLHRVAQLLQGQPIGNGAVARACRAAFPRGIPGARPDP